jgi:excisionase family DNA binding protein
MQEMGATHELLTVAEVAALLQAHPDTVRRWARRGELDVLRIGRRLYFDRDHLRVPPRGGGRTPS